VLPVGDELVRDSGDGDLLLTWRVGHSVRASVRPNGGRFSAPRTIPGLYDAIANDSLTEPFLGAGGRLLWGWRPGAGDGDTSRMLVVNGLGRPAQTLPTNPASVALGPLAREADVGTDGDAAIVQRRGAEPAQRRRRPRRPDRLVAPQGTRGRRQRDRARPRLVQRPRAGRRAAGHRRRAHGRALPAEPVAGRLHDGADRRRAPRRGRRRARAAGPQRGLRASCSTSWRSPPTARPARRGG
jgi:hypothetical protein